MSQTASHTMESRTVRRPLVAIILAVICLLSMGIPAALAELERAGPVSSTNGFPEWYQDKTGVTLEFGSPLNQAELAGGWNLILPANVPSGTAPESFPANFATEHFYWAANAKIDTAVPAVGTVKSTLVLGLEGGFGTGVVVPGNQITFGRVRVKVTPLPYNGTYKVYTPYTVWTFPNQVAGDRIFFTEDVGIGSIGQFDAALLSHVGPFLLPSNTPGGAELPAIPGPVAGKLYIADPARLGPVTGSPLAPFTSAVDGLVRDSNIFRVEGPNGFVAQTTDFSLAGRVFQGGDSRSHHDRPRKLCPDNEHH